MNKILLLGFCLLFLIQSGRSWADVIDNPCHKTTEGKDFWFGFMESRNYSSSHYVEVTMTSTYRCNYQITIGHSGIVVQSGTISPNDKVQYKFPEWSLVEATESESIQDRAIHITSDNPMNVYALNYDKNSADVALIFPTSTLGKEYYAACYEPNVSEDAQGGYKDGRNSEFLVIATEDNTLVTITPSMVTDQKRPAKVPFNILLNKGQAYQVQSMNHKNLIGQGDLTGSYVISDKPIAFFSGSLSTTVPVTTSTCCWDHLYEQIPPVQAWGKRFMAVPLKSREKDTYRILAAYDNTMVKVGTDVYSLAKKGDWKEFSLGYTDPRIIESTKPALLVQYSNSRSVDDAFTGGNGDPFMIIVSPLVQTNYNITFVAYSSTQITDRYFVNVIVKDGDTDIVKLDHTSISFTSLAGSGYSYAQVLISQGTHTLYSPDPERGFIAYVYGYGGVESYGYGAGFNLDIQLELGLSHNANDTLVVCKSVGQKLEAGAYFDKYEWNTGETAPFVMVTNDGYYKVKASTNDGCVLIDSVYVKVNDPKIDLGIDRNACNPGEIVLDAGSGFTSYLWQDGSTNQRFVVNNTGDFKVVGTNKYYCQAKDSVKVDVFRTPKVKIDGDTLFCGVFTAKLHVDIQNVDTVDWNYSNAAKWSSLPEGLEFSGSTNDQVTVKANIPGLYIVNYKLTTKDGCTATASFNVGLYETPQSTFNVYSPESSDRCGSYGRIVEYIGNASSLAQFNWDFGGLMVLNEFSPTKYKVSIGANNPQRTIKLTVKDHGCVSAETAKMLGVTPQFEFSADKNHGCNALPVNFSAKVSIEDPVSYSWSFGDGTVSTENPVQHNYSATGSYDVSLKVINLIDGCTDGWTEKNMIVIDPIPIPQLLVDQNACHDVISEFACHGLNSDSKCEWYTEGNRLLSNTNDRAVYSLENEFSTIGIRVEEKGCTSDWLKVDVKRKPKYDFEASKTEVCLPDTVHLHAISNDQSLNYSWELNSITGSGANFDYKFGEAGDYNTKLTATSNLTLCTQTVSKDNYIQIKPLPTSKFTRDFSVATEEHSLITFTNLSEGAESYLWIFGDEQTGEEINPKHSYSAIGVYKVLLEATSDFGCTDTISSSVKIIPFSFFVPNAFRPDSKIEENRIFIPVKDGIDPQKYHFEIFDRIGSVVFETRNIDLGWNGKMPGGSNAEPGIYVWIIKYNDLQGYLHQQKGTVMLVK